MAGGVLIFRLFAGGCKATLSDRDRLEIVRQLFQEYVRTECGVGLASVEFCIERMAHTRQTQPDLLSYDVIAGLGSGRLREMARGQRKPLKEWMLQEAAILELDVG